MLPTGRGSHFEVYVKSGIAVTRTDILRLGRTDCAVLSTDDARFHRLTVDLDLYVSVLRAGRPVTDFRHATNGRI